MTKVVNLFGGPCSGKSTTAAGLFYQLKSVYGRNIELVQEFVKELVYEDRHDILYDQMYIFAQQTRRINRLIGKVDIVVVDSPILLSGIYYPGYNSNFKDFVLEEFNSYDNLNFFLERKEGVFDENGRIHTEEQSKELDILILDYLESERVNYEFVLPDTPIDILAADILSAIND